MIEDPRKRAERIRDKVLITWQDPPDQMRGATLDDVTQTLTMITIVYLFPNLWPNSLTEAQEKALAKGLVEYHRRFDE